jgi:hypothetical protein
MSKGDNKRGRGGSDGSNSGRLSPIARELNPESYPVGDTQRFPKAIAGDPFVTGDPIKQYATGRICSAPGCETRLSRYNPNDTCSEHPATKMLVRSAKIIRIDTKKLRRTKAKKAANKNKK